VVIGGAALAFVALAPRAAKADPSAWAFVGGGATTWRSAVTPSFTTNASMSMDFGVGTSPDGKFILGGYYHLQPIFGSGTDMAAALRIASHGFQAGDWGFAFDAGGYARFWGEQTFGFFGGPVLGAPAGLELHLDTELGSKQGVSFGATAGVDLLRLTVYRQTLLDHWYNPSPAQQNRKALLPRHLHGLQLFL
jgi:hypothetical protein